VKGCLKRVQPEVKKNFEESVNVLKKFAEVEEDVAFPDMPFTEAISTIVRAEGASAFRDLLESGKATKLRAVSDRAGGYAGAMVLAVDYIQAQRLRGPMKKALDELYSRYDALIAPSRATVSYPIEKDFDKVYTEFGGGGPALIPAGNAAGQPALSIPNGFGEKDLPTGLLLTGRIWSEATLLAIARAYQQATDWHKRRPKLS
jgi:aspartyl-tRNA(Asn)/glutamyl-tRNA(Gln) amidotransferase subunit A